MTQILTFPALTLFLAGVYSMAAPAGRTVPLNKKEARAAAAQASPIEDRPFRIQPVEPIPAHKPSRLVRLNAPKPTIPWLEGSVYWKSGPEAEAGWKLRAELAQRRETHLENLRGYIADGLFPKNVDTPEGRVPVFLDEDGVACAMGHLIIRSGGRELAEAVARIDNKVRLTELVDGPVVDWILASGLTQEEASWIQPGYAFMKDPRWQAESERRAIQAHLTRVADAVERDTEESLDLATERLLARVRPTPIAPTKPFWKLGR